MAMLLPLIFLVSFLSCFSYSSLATETLLPSDTLSNSQTLVSAGGFFELGLFNEGSSGYYYVGIWFRAAPSKVVWVDRDNSILDSSGLLQIRSGNLVLTDRQQVPLIVNLLSLANVTNTSATILDTGNFVLKGADTGTTTWQSFDIPTKSYESTTDVSLLSNQSFALPLPKEPAFLSRLSSNDADSSSGRQRNYSQNDITISEEHGR